MFGAVAVRGRDTFARWRFAGRVVSQRRAVVRARDIGRDSARIRCGVRAQLPQRWRADGAAVVAARVRFAPVIAVIRAYRTGRRRIAVELARPCARLVPCA